MPNTSTAKPKRPSKEEPIERRPFPLLEPGIYVLTQDWVHSRPDNRLSGRGVLTPEGFRKGTRFRVREETDRFESDKQLLAEMGAADIAPKRWFMLHTFTGYAHVASGNADGWHVDESRARLIAALEPDLTNATWLDDTVGDFRAEVLEHLLSSGMVTRDQILAAKAVAEARFEEENGK